MRTSDIDLTICINKVVEFLKTQTDWISLPRTKLSKILKMPMGYRLNKVAEALRYHPNIASQYRPMDPTMKSGGRLPLYFRYVETEEEKYKLSLTTEAVTFMTPEQYLQYSSIIVKLFQDKKERLMAYRLLDVLYCQHYDTQWLPIDMQKLVGTLAAISRRKIRELIHKFIISNILLVSADSLYRLASVDEKENKKYILDRMRSISGNIPVLNSTAPEDLEFGYLESLNCVSEEVSKLQKINTDITKSLSDIVLALNQLQKTDHVIKNSNITFVRLNQMYQELRDEYREHIEAERKLTELISGLDNEPLTGKSMRILKEMKRILHDVAKEHKNKC